MSLPRKKPGATLSRDQGNRLPARSASGLVTYAELAREVGLTSAAISYKIRRGMSVDAIRKEGLRNKAAREAGVATGKAKQGGVPKSFYAAKRAAATAEKQGQGQKQKMKVTVPAADGAGDEDISSGESLFDAQTRKERALANLKELEEAQKRGELVSLAAVTTWMSGLIVRARDAWFGIEELADRIRQEQDVVKARKLIRDEVVRGLEELEKFAVLSGGKVAGEWGE